MLRFGRRVSAQGEEFSIRKKWRLFLVKTNIFKKMGIYKLNIKIQEEQIMTIGNLINQYGKIYSPYQGDLVNHLPMGQLALYKMTQDLEKIKIYSEKYSQRTNINPIKSEYPKAKRIEDCLGKPELYEACLELIANKINPKNMNEYIYQVLNKYDLGMSSGLFHTIIRVAYAVEGVRIDGVLIDEVARALAYYVTAYKPAAIFPIGVKSESAVKEVGNLIQNPHIIRKVKSKKSLGQKLKTLYSDEIFMNVGFVIDGAREQKINTLLDILIPAYKNTNDIVVLHCITGLHALLVLKGYYDDLDRSIDILTTCIIVHLLTVDNIDITNNGEESTSISWEGLIKKGSKSSDVHTIKLTYSASELFKEYENPGLKDIVLMRLKNEAR